MSSSDHEEQRIPEHAGTEAQRRARPAARPGGTGPSLTKLLYAFTKRHRGKALELDAADETLRVLGPGGEQLAVVQSDVALDQLLEHNQPAAAGREPGQHAEDGANLSPARRMRVTAQDREGGTYEGTCPCIGEKSLFLELAAPPAAGTSLTILFIPAGDPSRSRRLTGIVAWVCPRPDEFGCREGVGVSLVGPPRDPAAPGDTDCAPQLGWRPSIAPT